MVKKIIIFTICILLALPVGLLYGCKDNGKIKINLGMWPSQELTNDIKMYKTWKELFEKEYPQYEIVVDTYKYSPDTFLPLVMSQTQPTVFETWFTEPQKLIDLKTADINNNGSLENLILTGGINNNRNVTLYVQNAFNGQLISSKLVGNSYFGYGQIILADVTGDGSPEIISIAEIGGNTGNETCDIETANENGLVKIDPGFSNPNYSDYDVSPDIFSFTLNCNTLNMYSNKFGKSCSVDLTNDTALQTAIAEGLEINPYVSDGPVYSLYNIGNDIYGLKMSRGVSGSCHADSIGGFDVYYRYADGIMQLNDIGFNSISYTIKIVTSVTYFYLK